jgi:hypothetical protein
MADVHETGKSGRYRPCPALVLLGVVMLSVSCGRSGRSSLPGLPLLVAMPYRFAALLTLIGVRQDKPSLVVSLGSLERQGLLPPIASPDRLPDR